MDTKKQVNAPKSVEADTAKKQNVSKSGGRFTDTLKGGKANANTRLTLTDSCFDLVVANIITSELILLANYIEKKIKKNGYLVLSGILDYQSKIILSKFRNFNIIVNKKISISGWVTIILKKEVKHNETTYLS